jgi:PEP-CTERM motif-containing protein
MFTTSGGSSGWAFSNGTDQASLVAFSDIDNSLHLGGSVIQRNSGNAWILHLDNALSYLVDDDDNDVRIRLTITSKPVMMAPEPSTWILLLSGSVLAGWHTRRKYSRRV